ncbi:MAG: InlB B-repeat-containing protein, partial [Victivallales bacterium]|nr:InlB B-repeat-containing protein [Victivallales bacterium]
QTTFAMPANAVTVTAAYLENPKYTVTVENGTADKTEAYAGETITITANDPAEHFQFDSWTGDVEFTNADAVQTTFAMPANAVTVTAAYLEDPKYAVTVVGGKADKKTAYEGEEITITANRPVSGQAFDAWSGDVDLADATATPTTFTMPGRAVSVTATFKTLPKTYKIVVVNGTTDKAKAAAGEIVTLTANPAPAGKVFDRWTGGAVFDDPNSPTTTFIMPAKAVTPKALYKRK